MTSANPTRVPLTLLATCCALLVLRAPALAICPEPAESEDGSRKGLSRRDFQKKLRHELSLQGGLYFSDIMGSSPLAGAAYTFHLNEDFALEASFSWLWLSSSLSGQVQQTTGYDLLADQNARIYAGSLIWYPFHGKFMMFNAAIPHFDFFLDAGVGVTDSRTSKGLTYSAGAGIKIFCTQWLSLRFEIKDQLFIQQLADSETLTNNLALIMGVGFWFPIESSE